MTFEQIRQSIHQAGEAIKSQATALGEAAKEKSNQLIDQWISTIPKLEKYGLKTTYFAVGISINPVLEAELQGNPGDFTPLRIESILEDIKGDTPLKLVFSTIKTAYSFHRRAGVDFVPPLTVKIQVRLSPEIKVAFGKETLAP